MMAKRPKKRREGHRTPVGSLNLSDRKDLGLLREAARRRWPTAPVFAQEVADGLRVALQAARDGGDVGEIVDVIRTAAVLEGQNQVDEHLADKNARLDAGKVTDRVDGFTMRVVGPPRPAQERLDGAG